MTTGRRRRVADAAPVAAAVLLMAGTVAFAAWFFAPDTLSRSEAEQQITEIATRDGRIGVRATCEGAEDGWRCRLRDEPGAYGTARVTVRRVPSSVDGDVRVDRTTWTYSFPVASTGVSSQVVSVDAGETINTYLYGQVGDAFDAVGITAAQTFDCVPDGFVDRPGSYASDAARARGPDVGAGTTCTGGGPVASARIERLSETSYSIVFTVPLPST